MVIDRRVIYALTSTLLVMMPAWTIAQHVRDRHRVDELVRENPVGSTYDRVLERMIESGSSPNGEQPLHLSLETIVDLTPILGLDAHCMVTFLFENERERSSEVRCWADGF